jgi:hypothetical protein
MREIAACHEAGRGFVQRDEFYGVKNPTLATAVLVVTRAS